MHIPSFAPGDPCPTCGHPLVRRARMFFWRGVYSDGAVCPQSNGLWPITGEEMEPLRAQAWTEDNRPADPTTLKENPR